MNPRDKRWLTSDIGTPPMPLPPPPGPLTVRLVREVDRRLSRAMQARLARENMAIGHWFFMRVLWREEGLNQRQLSEQVGVMESTAFTALSAMERLGYITRANLPGNRKNMHIFLTERGKALKETCNPLADKLNGIALDGFDEADLAKLRELMFRMLDNLNADYEAGHP